MRRVFKSADDVIAKWAEQSQPDGRSKNASFQGAVLRSYAAQIAEIVSDIHGKPVALVTSRGWSCTTGRHQSAASGAAHRQGLPVFCVYSLPLRADGVHKHNLAGLLSGYHDSLESDKRRRELPTWSEDYRKRAVASIEAYAGHFGLTVTIDAVADWQGVVDVHAAKAERAADPKIAARREKEKARRDSRNRADYRNLRGKFSSEYISYSVRKRLDEYITESDRLARQANIAALKAARRLTGDWRATIDFTA